jgi:uncharacterized protein (TIGR03435 family)
MEGTVDEFCHMLERDLDRPVIDETKLDGRFEFQRARQRARPA